MIMNKASCLSLLSNAVVLWNTLQIERIVTELRAGGTTIRYEDLVHVWSLPAAKHRGGQLGVQYAIA
jgi:hypothetical protein